MTKRIKLRYELIDNTTGKVIKSFTNKTAGLAFTCQYVMSYPECMDEITFLVIERGSAKIVLRLTGEYLRQVCEDEGIEVEDDLGYEES
jgi:hypothetical protein